MQGSGFRVQGLGFQKSTLATLARVPSPCGHGVCGADRRVALVFGGLGAGLSGFSQLWPLSSHCSPFRDGGSVNNGPFREGFQGLEFSV